MFSISDMPQHGWWECYLWFFCVFTFPSLLQSEINTLHTFSQSFTCLVSIFTVPFLRPPDNPSSSWYIRTTRHSWVRSFPGFFFLSWDVKASSQHLQPASQRCCSKCHLRSLFPFTWQRSFAPPSMPSQWAVRCDNPHFVKRRGVTEVLLMEETCIINNWGASQKLLLKWMEAFELPL